MKLIIATHNFYKHIYKVGDSHLADVFCRLGHQVLYLSGPINIFRLRFLLNRNAIGKEYRNVFKEWLSGGIRHDDALFEYHPLSLVPISQRAPFGKSNIAMFHNISLTIPPVFRYIEKHGFSKPDVLMVSQLQMAELLDKIDAEVRVLRLTDDAASFDHVPDRIKKLERHAIESADIVLVTSKVLRDRLSSIREDIVHVPNAVDYNFFQSANKATPVEYTNLKGPIVVYAGAIEYWFDVELVRYLAGHYPEIDFVYIGMPSISLESIYNLKNVHLLGPIPYPQLPKYFWNATVGIIPFKKVPVIKTVSPIKLWEYMACGLPVVATKWRELELLRSPALLADTYSEFAEQLLIALEAASDTLFKERCKEFSASNTWDKRAYQILKLVEEFKE